MHNGEATVDPHRVRSPITHLVVSYYLVVGVGACALGVLACRRGGAWFLVLGAFLLIGGALVAVEAVALARRGGVVVSSSGVVIDNGLRRYELDWSAVEGFCFGDEARGLSRWRRWNGGSLETYVEVLTGPPIVVRAMRSLRSDASRARVQDLLDELERARTRRG